MKKYIFSCLFIWLVCSFYCVVAQPLLVGHVSSDSGEALPGASIRLQRSGEVIPVDAGGNFRLRLPDAADTLLVTHIGFKAQKVPVGPAAAGVLNIRLLADANTLQEVEVNTGYYSVPKERATGSFTHVGSDLLNRSVGLNILDRLEGVTNGLLFDRRNLTGENVGGAPDLRVRGLSTIEANSAPLIIVDKFPYEGDISAINPNDIASITVLKDAAAASIWGARAGNGVIVITTKQGHYDQPARVSFNSNVNVTAKPDLFYNQGFLPPATVMEIQKDLFERGAYAESDRTRIPLYAELLIERRDGMIGDDEFERRQSAMEQHDIRRDWLNYLARTGVTQQYFASVQGGGGNVNYSISAGYDNEQGSLVGNGRSRMSLGIQNNFKVNRKISVSGSVWYTSDTERNDGIPFSTIGNALIYESLKDESGQPSPVNTQRYRYAYHKQAEAAGLLDWMYRPLDEVNLTESTNRSRNLRLNAGIQYALLPGLDLQANYQYTLSNAGSQRILDKDSYEARDLINRLTDMNGNRIIPYGGILEMGAPVESNSHSGRVQVNYRRTFSQEHELTMLAGAEIRQFLSVSGSGMRQYNYNPDTWTSNSIFDYSTYYPTRPSGSMRILSGTSAPNKTLNRNLSYFANASHVFREKYILSGSIRWDGSNLLGVKTNQRGVALWSMGGSWEISKEGFYQSGMVPYLRLRATYGSAGNIDKTQSYYPTIYAATDYLSGLPIVGLTSPGNPSLRWEQVNTINMAVDWQTGAQFVDGSIEVYRKNSKHLLGANLMDPTTGIMAHSGYKMNYGDLRTDGLDLQVNFHPFRRRVTWDASVLLNFSRNKITYLNRPAPDYASNYVDGNIPEMGKSVDVLYALPWYGLSPENGMPMVFVDGDLSTQDSDYERYLRELSYGDLRVAGVAVPPVAGSLRNSVSWKGLTFDVLVAYKFGHVFRRNSIAPGQEFMSLPIYHTDYFRRWQNPGDERKTNVPAAAPSNNISRSEYYLDSEALVLSGDVIRLQDINISYTFNADRPVRRAFRNVKCFVYGRNLGILWRANKEGLDPDYPATNYPAPKYFAIGIQTTF
ncbi:SusC/RagA family TonB-linked outer membrane protein [Parapedobacter defluvii]|uniref:SusC/RagA family TonB-linked outer membrane protein n=1 Tax=Parapedobacter defluvii TaxID=2045106 RepID=A0ABQ1N2R8_9SPHI|nr:SusC/RagA family TonB-linked outer membrane protein [Parapedobacter defluvii]GGC47818.1 SusC/RagA family TonB-linked outer membrane protein [Parapedobacter defluvii]